MKQYEVNTTYEPFSREPEYIEANRSFIQNMDLTSGERILDLACGTGTMTGLVLEIRKDLIIFGMDLSFESLLISREHFNKADLFSGNGQTLMKLLHGTGDCLPLKDHSVDTIIMGNSIHLLPDVGKLLCEIRRVLRPNGVFAFNTSFYAGTMPKGTEKFHHEWVKQAASYIMRKDLELRKQGLAGIPRKRGTVSSAFSNRWPSPQEWSKTLKNYGFKVHYLNERTVVMTQRSFESIGSYGGFAEIILSGYPVREGSEALQHTVAPTLALVNMQTVPRYWLEMIAILRS